MAAQPAQSDDKCLDDVIALVPAVQRVRAGVYRDCARELPTSGGR